MVCDPIRIDAGIKKKKQFGKAVERAKRRNEMILYTKFSFSKLWKSGIDSWKWPRMLFLKLER